jgi:prolycopene isomerase
MPLFDRDFPKDLTAKDYKSFKSKFVEHYIRDFEQLLGVDIRSHIEEIAIATPVTFARYLGTPKGSIYGYRTSGWDSVMMRSINEAKDFTIKGLHFVGGHHTMGDGFSSAYITGAKAANALVKRYKKEGK